MGESISRGDFVKISYTARLEDGTIIDSTDEEVAKSAGIMERVRYGDLIIVVGDRHVIEGLDDAIEGKEIGFEGEIEVPPEKAFGEYDPDKKETITLTKFKERPEIGQRIQIGDRWGTVERIIGRRAIVDFNHPYAGKKIVFDLKIKEKIEDKIEKIKALFLLYTTKDVNVEVNDGVVEVEVPRGASFDQYFIIGKFSAIDSIFRHIEDVEEIRLVEKFPRPEKIAKEVTGENVQADETEDAAEETSETQGKRGKQKEQEEQEKLKTEEKSAEK
jgi:FKBP-type peptidyl-prolyl cis-trans isomerase SlyD